MASDSMVEISGVDLKELNTPRPASIADVEHLSSYSWIEETTPTIVVPGLPRLWTPPKGPRTLEKDSGVVYIAQNAARHPDSPMESLLRALLITHPSFDLRQVDVNTDRNNLRKLIHFINPRRESHPLEGFTINVEVIKNTAILGRSEAATIEHIGPHEFRGFSRQFEDTYTTAELCGSRGHYRILSYSFCGMKFVVRHETHGYTKNGIDNHRELEGDELSDLLGTVSLSSARSSYTSISGSRLRVGDGGYVVPLESTLEIKTRSTKNTLSIDEVAPQLWISQTPNLVRAYHDRGRFLEPKVEDVSSKIQHWEATNQLDLTKLGGLIEKIIHIAKSFGGKVTIEYDAMRAKLVFYKNADLDKMLPGDLYARWGDGDAARQELVGDSRVDCRQGVDETVQVPNRSEENALLEMGMGEHVVRDDLPFAAVIRSAVTKGFRQFFRNMPTSLGDYHTLCESLRASNVDVLQGRQVRDLMADLRSGKEDWDTEGYYKISKSKNVARDSAFRLLYIFLQEKTEDSNAAYNATLFVVSHYRIFWYKTRKVVRQAFDSTFTPSAKQKKELDKWPVEENLQEDDASTEKEVSYSDYWDSDYS